MATIRRIKPNFYKKVFERLLNGQPISERMCKLNGFDIELVYKMLRKQTKIHVRMANYKRGKYIFNWHESYDMREMFIEAYLESEMPKHELKYNEVKI